MNILGRLNRASKTVLAGIISSSLFLLPLVSFAQDDGGLGPDCGDSDIVGTNCPIDTWVVFFAIIAVIFAAIYLHRKQRSPQPTAEGIK